MPDTLNAFAGWQRFNGVVWLDDADIIVAPLVPAAASSPLTNASTHKLHLSPGTASFSGILSPGGGSPRGHRRHGSPMDMGFRSASPLVLETLYLVAPAMQVCAGHYNLVAGKRPNGMPHWKQQDGSHFIFSGIGGRWFVGDEEEEQAEFDCNA